MSNSNGAGIDVVGNGNPSGATLGKNNSELAGFHGSAVVQHTTTGTTVGFTQVGAGTAAFSDSTFTGDTGTAAYTIGDIVLALKNAGLMEA